MKNKQKNKKLNENNQTVPESLGEYESSSPLITVAVPIYNSEKHLKQCLESIVTQSYRNLDILLVNDGSTDLSMEICEAYRAKDTRVRVFHKKNGGVGASRNTLLEHIEGEYVTFVDNDDWLEEDHISKLYEQLIRQEADIAVSNFCSYVEEKQIFRFHLDYSQYFEKNYSPEEWFEQQYDAHEGMSQCFTVPWGKLYKSSLLENLAFPEDKAVEDDYTTYLIYLKAQKISYGHRQTYIHRKSGQSITQTVSPLHVFPLQSIEERLTLLSILGYDLSHEMSAYVHRLHLHQAEHLKNGNIVDYRRVSQKLELLQKYKGK